MDITSVNGHDRAAVAAAVAARAPAPQLRTTEAAQQPAKEAREPEPSEDQVQRAATAAEASSRPKRAGGARFRIDQSSKRMVAEILDENREVIRQIPPEEVLRIAARFRELQGLLFDERT